MVRLISCAGDHQGDRIAHVYVPQRQEQLFSLPIKMAVRTAERVDLNDSATSQLSILIDEPR
jgi:hypothetical protein